MTKIRIISVIVLSILALTMYGYMNNPKTTYNHNHVSGTELVVHTVVSVWKLIDNM